MKKYGKAYNTKKITKKIEMKVHVCFEAYYSTDIAVGSTQEAFYDENKAKEYCKNRQTTLDKLPNNTITVKYWTLNPK